MQNKRILFPLFITLFIICLFFIILSLTGVLSHVSFINTAFAPLQKIILGKAHSLSSENPTMQKLQDENNSLRKELVDYKNLQAENTALRDQFQTTNPVFSNLLPADIVGEPGFIPNVTTIESIVIDKGLSNGVKEGSVVVYKNNLVGRVIKVTNSFAEVSLVSSTDTTFTAKTVNNNALGIIKGQGQGEILLDDVVIDQKLSLGETVVTGANTKVTGQGFPPNLIVGKITGINKNPSALFQQADVQSLIDITKLNTVFVIVQK